MQPEISNTETRNSLRQEEILFVHLERALLKGRISDLISRLKVAFGRSHGVTPVHVRGRTLRGTVIEKIREARLKGARIVLVGGKDEGLAQAVLTELGLFDEVLPSDAKPFRGSCLCQAIRSYCRERGFESFDYIGSGLRDLPTWQQAKRAYAVNPSFAVTVSLLRRGIEPIAVVDGVSAR